MKEIKQFEDVKRNQALIKQKSPQNELKEQNQNNLQIRQEHVLNKGYDLQQKNTEIDEYQSYQSLNGDKKREHEQIQRPNKDKDLNQETNDDQGDKWKEYNFFMNTGIIGQIFLVDLFKLLLKAARDFNLYKKINTRHLPHLLPEHRIENIYVKLQKYLDEAIDNAQKNGKPLEGTQFVWIFLKMFKWHMLIVFFFCVTITTAIMFASISTKYLVLSVEKNGVTSEAYLIALKLGLAIIYYSLFYHNIPRINSVIFSLFKNTFLKVLFNKISSLSSYSLQDADIGKLINIATNDLAIAEDCFLNFMEVILTPYPFLVTSYLIFSVQLIIIYLSTSYYGHIGLVAVVFISLSYIVQGLISLLITYFYNEKQIIIDERVNQTNKIIEGIRIIKMYAWEEPFIKKINQLKFSEFKKNILIQICHLMCKSIDNLTSLLGAAILFSLVQYYGDGKNLDVGNIFSTLSFLNILKNQVFCVLGPGILSIFNIQVVLQRMASFFAIKNTIMTCIQGQNNLVNEDIKIGNIEFKNFTAYWQPNIPVLKDINLSIKKGECVSIIGKVGSGKTSLLSCILQEIPFYKGGFKFNGKLAYVEQEPFIFNSTIKENITFGKVFKQDLYEKVLESCCLLPDLQLFENGDQTSIGERGINISGGQKARISLARALYSEADIYLFDDPLSAVDANVAQSIFFDAIKGVCLGSTIILTTHQISFTKHTDKVIILEDGEIIRQGHYSDLEIDLIQLQKQISIQSSNDSVLLEDLPLENSFQSEENQGKKLKYQKEKNNINSFQLSTQQKTSDQHILDQEDELSQNTGTTLETYKFFYNLSCLPWSWVFIVLLYGSNEMLFIIYNGILGKIETEDKKTVFMNLWFIILIYFVISLFKNSFAVFYLNDISYNLHEKMIETLLRLTVQFFNKIPSGNILNLFSTDIGLIDTALGMNMADSLEIIISALLLLGYISYLAPYFIIVFFISLAIIIFFVSQTKHILQHTKQLDLNLRAPIFTLFNAVISGALPIKVYKQEKYFEKQFNELGNNQLRATLFFLLTDRGFGYSINLFSGILSAFGILLIISVIDSGPLICQSIIFFMSVNESLQWGISFQIQLFHPIKQRQIISSDLIMQSLQRCKYLVEQKLEPQLNTNYDIKNFDENKSIIKCNQQSQQNILEIQNTKFPSNGEVIFKNVFMRYDENLNYVLKDLSFTIQPGQRVGIVGRTGAGKSSIIQALFRMVEIENYNQNISFQNTHDLETNSLKRSGIFIDGHNIQNLGLHTLRKGISIIPQVPYIFPGTIRFNLDPLNQYSDKQIEDVLDDIDLLEKINSFGNKMYTDMRSTEQFFSSGQKQLFCLGRAFLRQSKLIVFDEATANIDMATDELIQKKIRQRFEYQTIITIAHRLNTIADYDHIIVMDQGKVVEQGTPNELLQNQNSQYYQMVQKTQKKNSNHISKISKKQKYNQIL